MNISDFSDLEDSYYGLASDTVLSGRLLRCFAGVYCLRLYFYPEERRSIIFRKIGTHLPYATMKGKVVPVYAVKAYGGVTPLILNLVIR